MKRKNYFYSDSVNVFLLAIMSFLIINILMSFVYKSVGASIYISLLGSILIEIGYLIVFLVYNKHNNISIKQSAKLDKKINIFFILFAIILGVVVIFASLNFTNYINNFFSSITHKADSNLVIDNVFQLILFILSYAVLPAIIEELVFRGIIYNGLENKFSKLVSVILSALIFMLIHFSIFQTVHQIFMGLILGTFVCITGNIIYGMVYHFVNNLMVILISFFKLEKCFSFSNFSIKEILLSILFLVVGIILSILIFFVIKKIKDKQDKSETIEKIDDKSTKFSSIKLMIGIAICVIFMLVFSFGG